jgi:hypothetical protein
MTIPLSPARGDVWASGSQGAAPVGIRGAVVETPAGNRLRLVRNGGGSTLQGCEAVEYMAATDLTAYNVQKNSVADNGAIAGVADHIYANKGKTIALGDLFWIVEHGPAYVLSSGTSIIKGDLLSPAAGTGLVDGAASTVVGVALETQASTAKSTLAFLRL